MQRLWLWKGDSKWGHWLAYPMSRQVSVWFQNHAELLQVMILGGLLALGTLELQGDKSREGSACLGVHGLAEWCRQEPGWRCSPGASVIPCQLQPEMCETHKEKQPVGVQIGFNGPPPTVCSSFKIKRNVYITDHGTCCERTHFGGALMGYPCFTAAPVRHKHSLGTLGEAMGWMKLSSPSPR